MTWRGAWRGAWWGRGGGEVTRGYTTCLYSRDSQGPGDVCPTHRLLYKAGTVPIQTHTHYIHTRTILYPYINRYLHTHTIHSSSCIVHHSTVSAKKLTLETSCIHIVQMYTHTLSSAGCWLRLPWRWHVWGSCTTEWLELRLH